MFAAASQLGYGADPHARALRTGRSGVIGLILRPRDAVHGSTAGTETFTRLLGTIAATVLEHKLGLVHVPDILDPSIQRIPMDGCLVAHPYGNDEVLGRLLEQGVATVTVDEDPDRPDYPWSVVLDHAGAVTELLELLYAEGVRRVLLLTGTEDNAWNRRAAEAYDAWTRRRDTEPWRLSLYEGEGVEGAGKLIGPLLEGPDRPDAVVATASRFAAGIADAAAGQGLSIPGQLMLAAVTDSEYTRGHQPPITSIDLALEDLAVASVELMLRQLAGEEPPAERPTLRPVLRQRISTMRRHAQ